MDHYTLLLCCALLDISSLDISSLNMNLDAYMLTYMYGKKECVRS